MTNRTPFDTGRRPRGGFTLVELLVVIGIIVVLFSIATPIVLTARRNADRVRSQADLNTIAQALEAYKNDFGDYPRPSAAKPTEPVLAWALIGPWPAVGGTTSPGDGADGPGFRTQWDDKNKVGSKVWGPYLSPEKFPTENVNGVANPYFLVDRFGTRIEYLPRWGSFKPGKKLFGVPGNGDPLQSGVATTAPGLYDCRQLTPQRSDDAKDYRPNIVYYLQRALGDGTPTQEPNGDPPKYPHDDMITVTGRTPPETALTEFPPYILLSRGYAKIPSTQEDIDKSFNKTSEVTNLQKP